MECEMSDNDIKAARQLEIILKETSQDGKY